MGKYVLTRFRQIDSLLAGIHKKLQNLRMNICSDRQQNMGWILRQRVSVGANVI